MADKSKAAYSRVDGGVITPYTIVIDTREKLPFTFQGLTADARQGGGPLVVRTERRGLEQGDYSLVGYEGRIALERKSAADLYGTVGQGRDRFERELERLNGLEFAAILIEDGLPGLLQSPPPRSRLEPRALLASLLAWDQRYAHVRFWPCGDRRTAEGVALRMLERFWRDDQDGLRRPAGHAASLATVLARAAACRDAPD